MSSVQVRRLLPEVQEVGVRRPQVLDGAISQAPFETLGAPRVGCDPEADAWLVERLRADDEIDDLEAAKSAMHGYYVLDLLPEFPGFPVYTSRGYDGVDRCTFRGKFLDDVQEIIGQPLYLRAWERMSATELREYGEALLAAGRRYAKEHGSKRSSISASPPRPGTKTDPSPAHIIFSAANWCLWWSSRGHGLEPWY